MKTLKVIVILSTFSLLLVACGGQQPFPAVGAADEGQPGEGSGLTEASDGLVWFSGQTREDAQGAVTVEVTGKNPAANSETLDFDVAMNTHSVNLDMDLAKLASLTTNTGISIDALVWTTADSGHHVSGTLSFPGQVNGVSILDGVIEITLTIHNVDAAERIFTWQAGG